MNKTEEIFNYIRDNFNMDDSSALSLVWNIVSILVNEVENVDDRISFAADLLDGLGLRESEIKALFKF